MTNETPTQIALFVPTLGGGGAERVFARLAGGFAASGLAVDLVLVRADGPCLAEVPPTVRIVDLAASRIAFSVGKLTRYLQQRRPRILISGLDTANIVAIAANALSRTRTPTLITVHSTISMLYPNASNRRARLIPALARRLYRYADEIGAVSEGAARDLSEVTGIPSARVHTLYNPVITETFLRAAAHAPMHPWLTDDGPPVVLAVGSLTRPKNFDLLLRAFAEVRRERDARLLILGEGEQRKALDRRRRELGIASSVDMPGFVSSPAAYMARASAFVLSSDYEGLSNVLVEALALGCPIVSTDCPHGPREILDGGRFGKLVPVGDAKSMAAALREVLDGGRVDGGAMRQQAARFSLESALARYMSVIGPYL